MIRDKKGPNLTIPVGAVESNSTINKLALQHVVGIKFYVPTGVEGDITIGDSNDDGATFPILQSNGSDVKVTAGKTLTIYPFSSEGVKIFSSANQAGADAVIGTRLFEDL